MVKLGGRPEHSHTHCISLAEHSPNHMMCVCMHAFFPTLWTVACQAPLSIEFSGQEYRSGLPFPSPGDLPSQGSYHLFTAPALAGGFFTTEPPEKSTVLLSLKKKINLFGSTGS